LHESEEQRSCASEQEENGYSADGLLEQFGCYGRPVALELFNSSRVAAIELSATNPKQSETTDGG
jgi:hypothetical protein